MSALQMMTETQRIIVEMALVGIIMHVLCLVTFCISVKRQSERFKYLSIVLLAYGACFELSPIAYMFLFQ